MGFVVFVRRTRFMYSWSRSNTFPVMPVQGWEQRVIETPSNVSRQLSTGRRRFDRHPASCRIMSSDAAAGTTNSEGYDSHRE